MGACNGWENLAHCCTKLNSSLKAKRVTFSFSSWKEGKRWRHFNSLRRVFGIVAFDERFCWVKSIVKGNYLTQIYQTSFLSSSPSLGFFSSVPDLFLSWSRLLTYFINQSKICTSQWTEISTSSHLWASTDRYSAKYRISLIRRSLGQVKSCFTGEILKEISFQLRELNERIKCTFSSSHHLCIYKMMSKNQLIARNTNLPVTLQGDKIGAHTTQNHTSSDNVTS